MTRCPAWWSCMILGKKNNFWRRLEDVSNDDANFEFAFLLEHAYCTRKNFTGLINFFRCFVCEDLWTNALLAHGHPYLPKNYNDGRHKKWMQAKAHNIENAHRVCQRQKWRFATKSFVPLSSQINQLHKFADHSLSSIYI